MKDESKLKLDTKVSKVIEGALKKGAKLHAFLSGGGLRVLRLEKEKLVGYGEHPYVGEAFRILADDYKAGGRVYGDVYGKIEENYLTGSSTPDDALDAWVRKGSTFDARYEDGKFVFELHGMQSEMMSEDLKDRAINGEIITYTSSRGVTYRVEPFTFPGNGSKGCSSSVVSRPETMEHHRAWHWWSVQAGTGSTLLEAIEASFNATPVEKDRH